MTWWKKLDHILTPRRLTYAWIAGAALWFAWAISCLLGTANFDLAGQVVGTDYLQFYSAGVTLRQGESSNLYNFEYQSQLEQTIAGPALSSYHAFLTPPFLAWIYVPFTFLPYAWSFVAWSVLGLVSLWASIKLLHAEGPYTILLWSLTWFPIFASIGFGQNSLLSLFLFSLTYRFWKKDKHLAAGFVSSLLLFKPQMVLGLGLLWLLEWRKGWRSILGLTIGGSILAGICFWLLPDASRAYFNLARNFLPSLIYKDEFPLLHLHALRGFWILLFPGKRWLAEGLSIVFSALGISAFILFWRKYRMQPALLFAAAICLTIWITPHAMIYDWSILIIPAIIFWQILYRLKPFLKIMYALIWIATFISGPFVIAQLKFLPIAIQISIPVLFLVYITLFRQFNSVAIEDGNLEVA